jgi:hypothetical protein
MRFLYKYINEGKDRNLKRIKIIIQKIINNQKNYINLVAIIVVAHITKLKLKQILLYNICIKWEIITINRNCSNIIKI